MKAETHFHTHFDHFFDAVNGTRQKAADFLIVTHVIRVSHAHEQYVCG